MKREGEQRGREGGTEAERKRGKTGEACQDLKVARERGLYRI
jgi:hypothetical protein